MPVPGPSSITAALSAAGLAAPTLCVLGFPPSGAQARAAWLGAAAQAGTAFALLEAPHLLPRARVLERHRGLCGERFEEPLVVARVGVSVDARPEQEAAHVRPGRRQRHGEMYAERMVDDDRLPDTAGRCVIIPIAGRNRTGWRPASQG